MIAAPCAGLSAIVLAAGRGIRMRSSLHKPLQPLAGAPMLAHVIDALADCRPERIVVVLGPDGEAVAKEMQGRTAHLPLDVVEQPVPRGTGDAAAVGLGALPDLPDDPEGGEVIILPGDAPLLRPATLRALVESHARSAAACTLLTAHVADPAGYGRVLRAPEGSVRRIVEQADASPDEAAVDEVATSVYVVPPQLPGSGAAPHSSRQRGRRVLPHRHRGGPHADGSPRRGVHTCRRHRGPKGSTPRSNSPARVPRSVAVSTRAGCGAGVAIADPATTHIDVTVRLAPGVVLLPGTLLEGQTAVGEGAVIGPHTRLVDCAVGAEAVVEMSWGIDAEIDPRQRVGPFAILGPAPT